MGGLLSLKFRGRQCDPDLRRLFTLKMQNKITTIFFDLFGVLLGIDQSVVVQYLSNLIETPYLEVQEIAMGEPFMQLERREINFNQYVEEIRDILPNSERIKIPALRDIWMNSNVGEMPAVSFIEKLQSNCEVWIISNTTESHIRGLQSRFAFLGLVGGIITSERAGAHKPNPKIFQFALTETNADATSSIFIDDSRANTESAESLGIVAHHYTDFDELLTFINLHLKI